MSGSWQTMPMIDCPGCSKRFQCDDYYDLKDDDEINCPHCEKTMILTRVDHVMEVCLEMKK